MIEFISVCLYIATFLISSMLISISSYRKKGTRILVFMALSLPILLAALRYDVGTDFFNYFRSFLSAKDTTIMQYLGSNSIQEFSRFLIFKVSALFNSYNIALGVYSLLSVIIIYFSIKNHEDKIYIGSSFFIYLCIYYPSSLNLMPQFVAISIVAFSFKYIFNKDFFKFSLFVILAALFHITALVAFPLYFLWDSKKKRLISNWKVFLTALLCLILIVNYQSIIEYLSDIEILNKYEMYAADNTRGQNRDLIFKFLLFIAVMILRKPLIKYDNRNQLYILLIFFNLIIGFTGFSSPWVKRISLYFEITQLFLVPSIIQLFKDRKEKTLIYFGVFLYAITYFIIVYYWLGNSEIIPYRFLSY